MASIERIEDTRRRFLAIAAEAGLPEPDEVHYFEAEDELEFVWHEQKLAVVVELAADGGHGMLPLRTTLPVD